MKLFFTLALRYLNGRKMRSFLTTLAVMFGVLVIFGMNILVPTMLRAFQATILVASQQVDLSIRHRTGETITPAVLDQVRSLTGIRAAQGLLARPLNLPADFFDHDPARPDPFNMVTLVGVNPDDARKLREPNIQAGRYLQATDTDAVVIASSLADNLDLQPGDTLSLPTAQGLTNLIVAGVYAASGRPGNEDLLVTLPTAQRLLAAPNQINTIEAQFDATDPARRDEIEQAVRALLGQDYDFGGLSTEPAIVANLRIAQAMFNVFGFLALFMGAFIIFNTFRTVVAERRRDIGMLRAIGASRRVVLGMILTEGLLQGIAGVVAGITLGYLIALVLLRAASPLVEQFIHIQFGAPVVTPALVVVTVVLGLGVTLLAGLLPALSAGRVTPLEALRPAQDTAAQKLAQRRSYLVSTGLGLAFIALALLILLMGSSDWVSAGAMVFLLGLLLITPAFVRPFALAFGSLLGRLFARQGSGFLAEKNLTRHPGRVAITASTTIVALAIVVVGGELATSVQGTFMNIMKQSLGSDYLFIPPAVGVWGNNLGADNRFTEQLRAIDGVGPVSSLRYAASVAAVAPASPGLKKGIAGATQGDGVQLSVVGIDPVTFPQVSGLAFAAGESGAAYAALQEERALIANGLLASSAGLKVGDTVPLITPEGRQDYRVAGIASDYLNAKVVTAYISHANLAQDFHKTEDVFVQLNLEPGADAAAVEPAIKEVKRNYPQFTMVSGRAYYQETQQLFKVAFMAIYVLFAFLAIPSLIAMLNTLAIGVIERTREIGMTRAVGAAQSQIRRMVLAEALLLAALGVALGLLAGLYLGYAMIGAFAGAAFSISFQWPWAGLAAAILIGLVFGGMAAILPARRAARMDVIAALRYE